MYILTFLYGSSGENLTLYVSPTTAFWNCSFSSYDREHVPSMMVSSIKNENSIIYGFGPVPKREPIVYVFVTTPIVSSPVDKSVCLSLRRNSAETNAISKPHTNTISAILSFLFLFTFFICCLPSICCFTRSKDLPIHHRHHGEDDDHREHHAEANDHTHRHPKRVA